MIILKRIGAVTLSVAFAFSGIGAAHAGPASYSPDQFEHRSDFINDEPCTPTKEADLNYHPWEQHITDEWDRYNGTASFTNTSDRPIKFSLEVTEGVNESVQAMSSGNMWEPFFNGLKNKYGIQKVSEWAKGDLLGPVIVQPGETVRADYGVHMMSFIGRVRTCDKRTALWRTEHYFGEYKGQGPQTRFVVWHRTTAEGDYSSNYQRVGSQQGSYVPPNAPTIDGGV